MTGDEDLGRLLWLTDRERLPAWEALTPELRGAFLRQAGQLRVRGVSPPGALAELLEALKWAANSIEDMRPTFAQVKNESHAFHDEVLRAARAAIAKAGEIFSASVAKGDLVRDLIETGNWTIEEQHPLSPLERELLEALQSVVELETLKQAAFAPGSYGAAVVAAAHEAIAMAEGR